MVFLPILSRWGGLAQRKLYATCVGVIFPVCLVSAAVYLFRGELSLLAALPYLAGRPGGRLDRREAVRQDLRQVAEVALRRLPLLRGGEVSAVTDWILPFLCGLGASILSAWGVGGGTLLLLVMTLFLDVDQRTAQGINLLFFLPAAASALVCHARGGYLDRPTLKNAIPRPWPPPWPGPGSPPAWMWRCCAGPSACICCSPASACCGRQRRKDVT